MNSAAIHKTKSVFVSPGVDRGDDPRGEKEAGEADDRDGRPSCAEAEKDLERGLKLGNQKIGESRRLTPEELRMIKKEVLGS